MPALMHEALTYHIQGAFFAVYNYFHGYGHVESVYTNALDLEFARRGLRAEREVALPVHYRGHCVGEFRADFVVDGCVLVELKAVERLEAAHERQLLNYLKCSGLSVGLLLNFGKKAERRRLIWTGTNGKLEDLQGTPFPD